VDRRKQEYKRLKRDARRAKRKYVTCWKVLCLFFLITALLATPLCLAVKVLDNVAAVYLGETLWTPVNEDANAVYFPMDYPSTDELQAHIRDLSSQVTAEGAVLLRNENNALPLSATEKIRAFGDSQARLLPNATEDGEVAVAVWDGADGALLQQLSDMKANGQIKKIVVLLTTLTADFLQDNPYRVDAVLWVGDSNTSVEDLLTGKVAPSGRLPKALPGFPFGFGLRYTSFAYSETAVTYNENTDRFAVAVTVTNTGSLPGKETVQVYAKLPDGTRKLAGFAKTALLEAGESRKITVYADRKAFAVYDAGALVLRPGTYDLLLCTNSEDNSAPIHQWEQAEAVTFTSHTPAPQAAGEMPTMGAQNNLKLYDMMGVGLGDPKWQTFLDQLTFEDMAAMIGDAYGGLPALESVQSPGLRNSPEDFQTGLPGGDMLAAACNMELAYEVGKAIGNNCLASEVDCLYNPGGRIEDFAGDSYLAGKICANQILGLHDKGILVAVTLDKEDPAAVQYVLRESKAGGVITDGTALIGDFTGMVISEKLGTESLLGGTTVFASLFPQTATLEPHRNDPAVVTAMRQACQYNLYAIVNSAAMNGFGKDTTVQLPLLPLLFLYRAVAAGSWVLFAIFAAAWAAGKRKWKRSQPFLNYKTWKNTQKELKKQSRSFS